MGNLCIQKVTVSSVVPNAHSLTALFRSNEGFPHLIPACSYAKWPAELYTCSYKLLTFSWELGPFNTLQNPCLLLGVRNSLKAKLCFSTYFILKKNVYLNPENETGR